jgi:hypothetical protein
MNAFVRASVLAVLALGAPALAHAQPGGVQVGTLACHQQPGWGYIIGSSRRLECRFSGAWGESRYVGRMTEAGVDVGYHGDSQMVWAVFAPTNRVGPGALAGQYGGATAGGAVGVGVAASGLIGGSDRSIALQPFSVTGKTGLSLTAGIQGMSLVYQRPRVAAAYAPPPPVYAPAPAPAVYEPAHTTYVRTRIVYVPVRATHHVRRHARSHAYCPAPRT